MLSAPFVIGLKTEHTFKLKHRLNAVLWRQVDPTGASILVGYEDGVIRLLNFHKKEKIDERRPWELTELILKFALKPHKDQITCIKIDSTATILATAVSELIYSFCTIPFSLKLINFYLFFNK